MKSEQSILKEIIDLKRDVKEIDVSISKSKDKYFVEAAISKKREICKEIFTLEWVLE